MDPPANQAAGPMTATTGRNKRPPVGVGATPEIKKSSDRERALGRTVQGSQ